MEHHPIPIIGSLKENSGIIDEENKTIQTTTLEELKAFFPSVEGDEHILQIHEDDDNKDVLKDFCGIVEVYENEQPFIFSNLVGKIFVHNGEMHRKNGPAVFGLIEGVFVKGWFLNGEAHRLDGPAFECEDSSEEVFAVFGKEMTKEQFERFQFLYEKSSLERTKENIEIFVMLAQYKE